MLRQAVGLQGRRGARFSAVVVELAGRWCAPASARAGRRRLPSAVLELPAHAFDLGGGEIDEAARRRRVGRRFLDTVVVASAGELASAFGWPRAAAGAALEELVERGEAVLKTGSYRPARSAAHAEDYARRSRGRA